MVLTWKKSALSTFRLHIVVLLSCLFITLIIFRLHIVLWILLHSIKLSVINRQLKSTTICNLKEFHAHFQILTHLGCCRIHWTSLFVSTARHDIDCSSWKWFSQVIGLIICTRHIHLSTAATIGSTTVLWRSPPIVDTVLVDSLQSLFTRNLFDLRMLKERPYSWKFCCWWTAWVAVDCLPLVFWRQCGPNMAIPVTILAKGSIFLDAPNCSRLCHAPIT